MKLQHLETWTAERRRIASAYETKIQNKKIRLLKPDSGNGDHIFPVFSASRDALLHHLETTGIQCLIHYPIPIHLQKAYQNLGYRRGDFPIAETLAETELSIPLYPGMTDAQIDDVIHAVNTF